MRRSDFHPPATCKAEPDRWAMTHRLVALRSTQIRLAWLAKNVQLLAPTPRPFNDACRRTILRNNQVDCESSSSNSSTITPTRTQSGCEYKLTRITAALTSTSIHQEKTNITATPLTPELLARAR